MRGNPELEQALLGGLLIYNEGLEGLNIASEHFFDPVHGRIFAAIAQTVADGGLASPLTIAPKMATDEGLAQLGRDYIARLAGAAISVSAIPHYARAIRDLHARRLTVAACEEAASLAGDTSADVGAALDRLEEHCDVVRVETLRKPASVKLDVAALAAIERMESPERATPMGIVALDRFMGGLYKGDLTILGGRPSMGKSALAIEIARRVARRDKPVIFWSLEMGKEDIALRMATAEVRDHGYSISYSSARRGEVSPDMTHLIVEAASTIADFPVYIIEPRVRDFREGLREVSRLAKRHDAVVIIDYLQLISTPGQENENIRIGRISQGLKASANELGVPVVCLSQLSRSLEARQDKRPQLSDLRDSGAIEQDADNVMFCYRPQYYLERAKPDDHQQMEAWEAAMKEVRGLMEVIIQKQRNGPVGTVDLGFDAATNSFWDWS